MFSPLEFIVQHIRHPNRIARPKNTHRWNLPFPPPPSLPASLPLFYSIVVVVVVVVVLVLSRFVNCYFFRFDLDFFFFSSFFFFFFFCSFSDERSAAFEQ